MLRRGKVIGVEGSDVGRLAMFHPFRATFIRSTDAPFDQPVQRGLHRLDAITTLPPRPEVANSLASLRDVGLRLAALTNSAEQIVRAQRSNAGLDQYFEQILSADAVRRLKPAPEAYQMASSALV